MSRRGSTVELPTLEQVEAERKRLCARRRYGRALWGIFSGLLVLAAASVLLTALVFPVLRVTEDLEALGLREGQILVAWKMDDVKANDLIAYYREGKIMVRQVNATSEEEELYTSQEGLQNQEFLFEGLENSGVETPLQLSNGQCLTWDGEDGFEVVETGQVIGPVLLRVWPIEEFAALKTVSFGR